MSRKTTHITTVRLRQLLLVTGLFLFGAFVHPAQSHALSSTTLDTTQAPVVIPLVENEKKINELANKAQDKQELVQQKQDTLEDVQKQADDLAATKAQLATQVQDMQAQIEELKAKIATKNAEESTVSSPVASSSSFSVASPRANSGSYHAARTANLYYAGYCTWYVKNRRPDIPNGWGNANEWYGSAKAAGYSTGTSARVGAVGVSFAHSEGHVVYVESVNGDGTVTIAEMNHHGLYIIDTRTVPESTFVYIY